ncbi:TonB-dependent receptor [Sulfuricurvum sp.]|uniref:TonB-dependent receptor n=1 Tax=Sulfuricurvum sp. TaxID=2025608 RepID=UPI00286DBC61|nr:TonB-dependent receptor [Sulfuricurvum sp.]
MKRLTLLSLAAVAALATEPVTIQKITIEAEAPKTDAKSVSSDDMVKFSRQSDLGEMLSQTLPEITHVRNSAIGNDIILRGFRKDNLNITIDDAKVCGACPNRMDPPSMHISSGQIQTVEVQEGPFDVTQFGSLGGKINVVTKDPEKGVHGEVSTTLGSFDYRKLSTTIEGGNDAVQALVGFSRETSGQYKDGDSQTLAEQTDTLTTTGSTQRYATAYKDMDAYDRNNYWAKIVGNIGDNQKLTLNYFGDRADDIMFPRYPMDALVDDTDMFKAKYQLFNLGSFSEEIKIEGYHSKVTHLMGTDYRASATSPATTMWAPAEATIKGAKIENSFTLAGIHTTFGLDASKRNWIATKGPETNSTRNYMLPDVDTENLAFYATASKTISNIDISGGFRYDDTTINPNKSLQDNASNSATYFSSLSDKNYNNISANLMLKYNISSMTNLFIGAGQSIRVPDAKELYVVNTNAAGTLITNSATSGGNQNLNESINREIDLGFENTTGNFHLKTTLFYSDLKDYIYAYDSTWANIDAKIYGGDISADYLLNNEWRIESGVAYQKGVKKNPGQIGDTDKDLAEIPPFKGRLALVMDDSVNYLMAEVIAADNQTIDSDNNEKEIAGYGILNLKYGYDFRNGFSLMTGINNFFNRTYAVNNSYIGNQLIGFNGTDPLVLNEPGRNFYATVSYKF